MDTVPASTFARIGSLRGAAELVSCRAEDGLRGVRAAPLSARVSCIRRFLQEARCQGGSAPATGKGVEDIHLRGFFPRNGRRPARDGAVPIRHDTAQCARRRGVPQDREVLLLAPTAVSLAEPRPATLSGSDVRLWVVGNTAADFRAIPFADGSSGGVAESRQSGVGAYHQK